MYKGGTAHEPRVVSINVQMQHDPWTFYQGGNISLESAEWKQYSHTFTATADVVNDMWVGLAIAQAAVNFWLDDFRFFEVSCFFDSRLSKKQI